MVNDQLADIFVKMGAYCEMSSERNAFFRARAFKKAAEIVEKLPEGCDASYFEEVKTSEKKGNAQNDAPIYNPELSEDAQERAAPAPEQDAETSKKGRKPKVKKEK